MLDPESFPAAVIAYGVNSAVREMLSRKIIQTEMSALLQVLLRLISKASTPDETPSKLCHSHEKQTRTPCITQITTHAYLKASHGSEKQHASVQNCGYLVAVFVVKAHDLVFDGGAISRAFAIQPAAVHRGLCQIVSDDLVCVLGRVRKVTTHLGPLDMHLQCMHNQAPVNMNSSSPGWQAESLHPAYRQFLPSAAGEEEIDLSHMFREVRLLKYGHQRSYHRQCLLQKPSFGGERFPGT